MGERERRVMVAFWVERKRARWVAMSPLAPVMRMRGRGWGIGGSSATEECLSGRRREEAEALFGLADQQFSGVIKME